jgi:hypothetical protein
VDVDRDPGLYKFCFNNNFFALKEPLNRIIGACISCFKFNVDTGMYNFSLDSSNQFVIFGHYSLAFCIFI